MDFTWKKERFQHIEKRPDDEVKYSPMILENNENLGGNILDNKVFSIKKDQAIKCMFWIIIKFHWLYIVKFLTFNINRRSFLRTRATDVIYPQLSVRAAQ